MQRKRNVTRKSQSNPEETYAEEPATEIDDEAGATHVDSGPVKVTKADSQGKQYSDQQGHQPWLPSIPGYDIKHKLGQGGMGSVFLAKDRNLGREVAIKIVDISRLSKKIRQRFEAEIQTLAGLRHDNIAQLYSAGQCNNIPYFVMQYVDGPTLKEFANEPLDAYEAARLCRELCHAVQYCHDQGVLHRDLKPANVLMTSDGKPKIADFGLAKVMGDDTSSTKTGEVMGTPNYMSPEQARGDNEAIAEACDIYALGAILYRLLAGRPPFVANDSIRLLQMVLVDTPISPRQLVAGTPVDLVTICQKCLEKEPARRYATVSDLANDLDCFLNQLPIQARPVGWLEKTTKWIKRNPAMSILIGCTLLTVVAALAGLTWHNHQLGQQLDRSKRLADRGSEFSSWVISEHLSSLDHISGTTKVRKEIVEQAKNHLVAISTEMPDDARYLQKLARSYDHLGDTFALGSNTFGDYKLGKRYIEDAIKLFEDAEALDAKLATGIRLERVDSMISLSSIYKELNDLEKSQSLYSEAIKLFKANKSSQFENQVNSLNLQIKRDEYQNLKDDNKFQEAKLVLKDLEAALEQISKTDFNKEELEYQRIWLLSQTAQLSRSSGDTETADTAFKQLRAVVKESYLEDRHNPILANRQASTLIDYGYVLLSQEKYESARQQIELALEIYQEIADRNPDSVEAIANLSKAHATLSDLYVMNEQDEAAGKSIDQAVALFSGINPETLNARWYLQTFSIYLQSQANSRTFLEKYDEAIKILERQEDIVSRLLELEPKSHFALDQLAESKSFRVHLLVGLWTEQDYSNKKVVGSDYYNEMISLLDESLSIYDKIAESNPLNNDQATMRDAAVKTKAFIISQAKKMDKLLEPGNEHQEID